MVLSSPAYSIGRSKRSLIPLKTQYHFILKIFFIIGGDWKTGAYYVPGSGAYNPAKPDRSKLPSWKIGTAPRGYSTLYPNPGPGEYENNNTKLVFLIFPNIFIK